MDPKRDMLVHTLATLAYRTAKAVQGAPPGFGDFEAGEGTRTPCEVLRHMADLLRFARSLFVPGEPIADPAGGRHDWPAAVRELREAVRALALELPAADVLARLDGDPVTVEQILQGPLCDAMTHAGQLAYLRRLAGSPVPYENFLRADVHRVLRAWTTGGAQA